MLSSRPTASWETLNSWELKGHSVSHAFEEERQAHRQTEEKAPLIFHRRLQKGRDREGTLTNWRFFQTQARHFNTVHTWDKAVWPSLMSTPGTQIHFPPWL